MLATGATFLSAQVPAPPLGQSLMGATYLGTVTGTDSALAMIQRSVDTYNADLVKYGQKIVGTKSNTA